MPRFVFAALLCACRENPGLPVYPGMGSDTGVSALPHGPDPYEAGEKRLSLSIFYEGEYSDIVEIDNVTTHFYIWDESMSVTPSQEVVEGRSSDQITAGALGWWGGGVYWDTGISFADWKTLHISLRSSDATMEVVELGFGEGDSGSQRWVSASSYGFVADDSWHHLKIPRADLAIALNISSISMPLNIRGSGNSGTSVLIDNVYYTDEELEEEEQ